MQRNTLPRQHLSFPTNQEAKDDPSLVNSDHLMVLGQVPLGDTNVELKIASLNTLAATTFSGFDLIPFISDGNENENVGECERYDRMMTGLVQSTIDHGVDIIFLQETNEKLAEEILKQKLGHNWSIITIQGMLVGYQGMLVAYNTDNYETIGTPNNKMVTSANGLISLTMKHKSTNHLVDLHNLWGDFNPDEDEHDRLEGEYRALFNQSPSDRTVLMFGDTNSRVAPLDDKPRNITTGIVPTHFNSPDYYDRNYQISDFPDGGFYRVPHGEVKQISTKVLDFETAKIVEDKRTKDEIDPCPRQVRVLTLDTQYGKEKEKFQKILGEEIQFTYEVTSNSFNEKMTCLRFNNKNDYDYFVNSLPLLTQTQLSFKPSQRTISIPRSQLKAVIIELKLKEEGQFNIAYNDLKNATSVDQQKPDSELKAAGREILQSVKTAKKEGKITSSELPRLTKFVKGTTEVVKDPTDINKVQTHAKNTEEAIGMNRQWGKLIGGAMLSFLGVALIAVSTAVAVATFGVSTPLSAVGLALGGNMVAAGVIVGVAAVSGLTLATAAGIFANRARKGEIAMLGNVINNKLRK